MGLGGYLTWTAVARELFQRSGVRVMPFEQHGSAVKLIKSSMFSNSPHVAQEFDGQFLIPMQLNNPETNYCKQDMQDRCVQRGDKHFIEQMCEFYGVDNPVLKCELFLTAEERAIAERITSNIDGEFLTIEPHSNSEYTPNRTYPFEKWQKIVNSVKIQVVQIGNPIKALKNVIDLTGKTTFREAAAVIEKSKLFVSTEGGLVHAATAVETTAVSVISDYETEAMVAYPQNINIRFGRGHGPCGYKIPCPQCKADGEDHDENEILKKIMYFLDTV
jgi:ADP-heptose:LPS heptosyltransferase